MGSIERRTAMRARPPHANAFPNRTGSCDFVGARACYTLPNEADARFDYF